MSLLMSGEYLIPKMFCSRYELEMGSGSCIHEQGPEVAAKWSLIHYGLDQAHTLTGLSPGMYS